MLAPEPAHQGIPGDLAAVPALTQAEVLRIIGGSEGQTPDYFLGRVVYATFDPEGQLVVVDQGNGEVRFFDREGRFLFKIGRKGMGPGEFDQPAYVAFDSRGWLYVLEEGRARLHRFRPEGAGFALVQTYNLHSQLQASPLGWCLLADTLYVYTSAVQEHPLFHVLTLDGVVVRTFGKQDVYPPEALPKGFAPFFLEARLYCDPYGSGLMLAYRYLPVLEYYTTSGNRRWRVRIDGAPIVAYRSVAEGRLQPALRAQGYRLRNLWTLPSGRVLIHLVYQAQRSERPLAAETIATYVFWLDPVQRQWGWQKVTFPFFRLYAWQGRYAVGISPESELPHVALFRIPETTEGT